MGISSKPVRPVGSSRSSSIAARDTVHYATARLVGEHLQMQVRAVEVGDDERTPHRPHVGRSESVRSAATSTSFSPRSDADGSSSDDRRTAMMGDLVRMANDPQMEYLSSIKMHPLTLEFTDDTQEKEFLVHVANSSIPTGSLMALIIILHTIIISILNGFMQSSSIYFPIILVAECVIFLAVIATKRLTSGILLFWAWFLLNISSASLAIVMEGFSGRDIFGVSSFFLALMFSTMFRPSMRYFLVGSVFVFASETILAYIYFQRGCSSTHMIISVAVRGCFCMSTYLIEKLERSSFILCKRLDCSNRLQQQEMDKLNSILFSIYPSKIATDMILNQDIKELRFQTSDAIVLTFNTEKIPSTYDPKFKAEYVDLLAKGASEIFPSRSIEIFKKTHALTMCVCGLLENVQDPLLVVLAAIVELDTYITKYKRRKFFLIHRTLQFLITRGPLIGGLLKQRTEYFELLGSALDRCFVGYVDGKLEGICVEESVMSDLKTRFEIQSRESECLQGTMWSSVLLYEYAHHFTLGNSKEEKSFAKTDSFQRIMNKNEVTEDDPDKYDVELIDTFFRGSHVKHSQQLGLGGGVLLFWGIVVICIWGAFQYMVISDKIVYSFQIIALVLRYGFFLQMFLGYLFGYYMYYHDGVLGDVWRGFFRYFPVTFILIYVVCCSANIGLLTSMNLIDHLSGHNLTIFFLEAKFSLAILTFLRSRNGLVPCIATIIWLLVLIPTTITEDSVLPYGLPHTLLNYFTAVVIVLVGSYTWNIKLKRISQQKASSYLAYQKYDEYRSKTEMIIRSFLPSSVYDIVTEGKTLAVGLAESSCCIVLQLENLDKFLQGDSLGEQVTTLQDFHGFILERAEMHHLDHIRNIGNYMMFASRLDTTKSTFSDGVDFCLQVIDTISELSDATQSEYKIVARACISGGRCNFGFTSGFRMCFDVWGTAANDCLQMLGTTGAREVQISDYIMTKIVTDRRFRVTKIEKTASQSQYFVASAPDLWECYISEIVGNEIMLEDY